MYDSGYSPGDLFIKSSLSFKLMMHVGVFLTLYQAKLTHQVEAVLSKIRLAFTRYQQTETQISCGGFRHYKPYKLRLTIGPKLRSHLDGGVD